jgi:hypothetical protein
MTVENAIRILAGTLVLIGLLLAWKVHAAWMILPAFVGVNLVQSAFTGFCPAEKIFRAMGLKDAAGADGRDA